MANITAKVEVITPEVAKCYLEHNEGNRILNKGQVAFFAKMMQEGTWQVNGEAIVFDKNGRLVNGQHRLSACLYANVPFETMVIRGVEEETFYTFDTGKVRTSGDVLKIGNVMYGTMIAAIINKYKKMCMLPNMNTFTNLGGQAKDYFVCKISNGDILKEYEDNPDYWQMICTFSASCYRSCRFLTISYIGGVVAFLNKEKGYELEYVCDFFEQLFFDERTELDIIRMLRKRLVDDAMKGKTVKMSNTYKEQLIIKTWECFKSGRSPKELKWNPSQEKERRFE